MQAPVLFTLDPRALNHVLNHAEIYYKPDAGRVQLARILGEGVLVVEGINNSSSRESWTKFYPGEKHRQQRRILVRNNIANS